MSYADGIQAFRSETVQEQQNKMFWVRLCGLGTTHRAMSSR